MVPRPVPSPRRPEALSPPPDTKALPRHGALLCLLLSGAVACSSPAPAGSEDVSASARSSLLPDGGVGPATFDAGYHPFNCQAAAAGDILGDPVTGSTQRDMVGDTTYPAFYRAADDSFVYFRLRVSGDPRRNQNSVDLASSSWDVLFDTDGNLATYEYMLTADGNMSGTHVQLVRNSIQTPSDPKDQARDVPADLLHDFLPATDYYRVQPTNDGSNFGGNPDWFVTLAVPRASLQGAGIDVATRMVVWGGTNAQNYSLNADFGCYANMPTNLADAAQDPALLDPEGTPEAVADSASTPEDTAVTTAVLANDRGLANTPITVTIATPPARGTATVNADRTITYTPSAHANGPDSYVYRVQDADGQTSTAQVSLTVAPVNDPPTLGNDSVTVALNSSNNFINVLGNDSFAPDGPETLTVTAVTQPASGVVTLSGGEVRYTPPAGFSGTTSFTYTVSDGNTGSATATVTLTVAGSNSPPTAVNDTLTVAEDSAATVVDVLANDSDPDAGDALAVTGVSQPANGSVTLEGGVVGFRPAGDFFGTTSFQYTLSDGNGGESIATVTVTVAAVNDPPTAANDTATVDEDSGESVIDVLANDSFAPDTGESLTVTAVTAVSPPGSGTVALSAGSVRFTPAAHFHGTASFSYTVSDGNSATATATVTVTVDSVNDAPTAGPDSLTVTEDSAATPVDVLGNDSFSPDTGETLSVASVTQPANGTVTVSSAGTVEYRPVADFHGTDTFTYLLSDGNGGGATGTVTVTVTAENDPPVARDDTLTVDEDSGQATVNVLDNDSSGPDTAEALTVVSVDGATGGTVSLDGGVVRFTPAADFFGVATFTYTVSDGNGGTAQGTVTVTVTGVNDVPVARNDTLSVPEDSAAATVDVLANDSFAPDRDETLTVTSVSQPVQGTATLEGGVVRFTPSARFTGTTSFTYEVSDGNGGTAGATVTVTVTAVDDAPVAADDTAQVDEDSGATSIDVLANDSDEESGALTVVAATQPDNGSVTFTATGVHFTPDADFFGTTSFTYTVSDGNGEDTGEVTVTVSPLNDAPVANGDTLTLDEDSAATTVDVLTNDSFAPDRDETLSVAGVTPPSHGTATLADGTVRYQPAANYFGPDSFTYTLSDGNGGTATATVSITVAPVNDAPTARADSFSVDEDSPAQALDVLANDDFAPDEGETLSVVSTTQPARGSVSLAGGIVRYTPDANFFGTESFEYTVSDGNSGTATATVTLTVAARNDAPTARADSVSVDEDSADTAVDVLANDSSAPDGPETLTVTEVGGASQGTARLQAGTVHYAPAPDFHGTDSFTYTVSDGNGGTATATVSVTVRPLNDDPVAANDSATVDEDSGATFIDVLANDSTGPDSGEDLTVTGVTTPANGTVTFTPGGVSFTPNADFHGTTSFTYTVSDGNGGTASASVQVQVNAVNDAPVARDDSAVVAEDGPATAVDVLGNDSPGPDSDETLTVTAVSQPARGTVTLTEGVVRFTPAPQFHGTVSFTYTVSDGNGGVADATVTVTVTPVNDPPVAVDDSATVDEDSAATVVDVLGNDAPGPDADETLTVASVSQPSRGTVTLTEGVVRYTPPADFHGTASFTYTLSDGNGGTASATVTVTVRPVNDAPVAAEDHFTVVGDTTGNVLAVLDNDSQGPDTDETLTVTAVTQGSHGTVALVDGAVSYTPAAGYVGLDTFTYTLSDGNGGTATGTVTVLVRTPDSDGDGIPDREELERGTDPNDSDSDDDGIPDGIEVGVAHTDPLDDDSDDDGLLDGTEDADQDGVQDEGETSASDADSDDDGLTDGVEQGLAEPEGQDSDPARFVADADPATTTDPLDRDTDNGGVLDGFEDTNHNGRVDAGETDPRAGHDDVDADGDGIGNEAERALGTDPFDNDSDDDGVPDGVDGGTDTDGDGRVDALDPDSDNDGLLDGTEAGVRDGSAPSGTRTQAGNFVPDADPTTTTDPKRADTDGDGLADGAEDGGRNGRVDAGETDPNNPDTDGDALRDGVEARGANPTDPLNPDTDGDGLSDGTEDANHDGVWDSGETSPTDADSDDGGLNDGEETAGGLNPLLTGDDLEFAGRGCSAAGTGLFGPLGLLLLAGLRRRRQARAHAGAVACVGLLALGGTARAQEAAPTQAIDIQQFKPGPGAHDVLGVFSARTAGHLDWTAGLSLSHGHSPLAVRSALSGQFVGKWVESQQTLELMGSVGLFERFELGAVVPVSLQHAGNLGGAGGQDSPSGAGLGDVRLVPKARLLRSDAGLELGVALPVVLPTAGGSDFRGQGGLGVQPRLLADLDLGSLRLLSSVGVNLRRREELRNLRVGNELAFGLGAELGLGQRWAALTTVVGAVGLSERDEEERPLEALAAVRYRATKGVAVQLGGGAGLTRGYGTPDYRLFAGLSYALPMEHRRVAPAPVVVEARTMAPSPAEVTPAAEVAPAPAPAPVRVAMPELPAPPVDSDGDGLMNNRDGCPRSAEDPDGFEDADGCPEPDNDGDGVADAQDRCPTEAEVINGNRDEDGCPDKGVAKVQIDGGQLRVLGQVHFQTNRAIILPRSFALLRQVAATLRAAPELKRVRVEGHTDSQGKPDRNRALSQARAESVREFLVRHGVEAGRLEAVGYGPDRPVETNKTAKGRMANRRVDFVIVEEGDGTAP